MTQNYKPAYPPEFRQQMVELVALGKCPKQLSKEFGCHYTSIQSWCRAAGVPNRSSQAIALAAISSGLPLNANERQELMELRKKLKRVEMERDILAKATAWFANNKD
jgi:transposase